MLTDLKVLVLARTGSSATALNLVLSQIPSLHYELCIYSGDQPLTDNLQKSPPDVIVLETERANEKLLSDIRRFVESYGHSTEVFAIFPQSDVQLVTHLVRSGVRDVLPQPVTPQELKIALANSRARQRRSAAGSDEQGVVSGFMKARGNAGGTFIAVNMAYLLAAEHRKKVALIDLDLQFGTIASHFDIHSDGNIKELLLNPDRIDAVYLDALMFNHASGLRVLPSPCDMSSYDVLTSTAVSRLLSVLAQSYDHVLISLPSYMNEGMMKAIRLCDPLFLVTQDTVSSLANLKMLLEHVTARGVPTSHLQVIHNRVGGAVRDIGSSELKRLIGSIPLHRVRSDYRLAANAENLGKPVCEISKAGICRDIHSISSQLAGVAAVPGEMTKRKPRLWFTRTAT